MKKSLNVGRSAIGKANPGNKIHEIATTECYTAALTENDTDLEYP